MQASARRLPLVVYVLAAGTFLMLTSEFVVAGLLPELARDFSIDVPHAGFAITLFAIGMIASPVTVMLTLRLPRRSTLAVLLGVFAVGHVVAALSTVFPLLLAARFVTALATGAFWAIAGLVAVEAAGDGLRSRALGLIQGGGMLATVIGVPIGAFAGQLTGWRGPFWALAVLALAAAGLMIRLVPHTGGQHAERTVRGELVALRSGRLWLVLATCALITGGVLSVYSYISPLLTERTALPDSTVPIALAVFGVAGLAGTILAGHLGDHRPYTTLIGAAAVTLVAVIVLGAVSTSPVPTLIAFGVLGLTGLSANPILGLFAIRAGGSAPTLASALTPAAFNTGTAIGTGITAAALPSSTLAPIVVGVVAAVLVLVASVTITLTRSRTADVALDPAVVPLH